MNEACLNLIGEDIASEKGHAFSSRVLDFMRDKLMEFQEETGNIYNPELAKRLKENVYEAGGKEDADILYRKFRGKDPSIDPLLRNRGFPVTGMGSE